MRKFLLTSFLWLALSFFLFGPILAFAAGNTSACYSIVRQDLRQQCLAEVSR